jgi:hypothetical protein
MVLFLEPLKAILDRLVIFWWVPKSEEKKVQVHFIVVLVASNDNVSVIHCHIQLHTPPGSIDHLFKGHRLTVVQLFVGTRTLH